MKLNQSQTESFELLYANISNALMYAKDLGKIKEINPVINPIVIKLEWIMSSLNSRVPSDKKKYVREMDTLFYDEMLRIMSGMSNEEKKELETALKQYTNG